MLEDWEKLSQERAEFRRIAQEKLKEINEFYVRNFPERGGFYYRFCKDVDGGEEYFLEQEQKLINQYKKEIQNEVEMEKQ